MRACLFIAMAVTTVVSFAYAVASTSADPALAFFATQSRAWEFALGGLVALIPSVRLLGVVGTAIGWVLGWAGAGVVVASALVLTEQTSFPGWVALAPTLGTAVVLAVGRLDVAGSIARASARGPVKWLGDHSYAVYLWHWPPIIALPWVLHGPLADGVKLGILGATLLLAGMTKRYVEDPVRSGAAWQLRRWASIGLATAGAAALVLVTTVVWSGYDRLIDRQADLALASVHAGTPCYGAAVMVEEGCSEPFARPAQSVVDFAAADISPVRPDCQPTATSAPDPTWCRFGDLTSPRTTIALVGNSYAVQLVPLLLEWTRGQQVRILLAARTDCLGLTTVPVQGQDPDDPCLAWSAHVQATLLAVPDLSLVILTGHERSDQFLTGQAKPRAGALADARRLVLGSLHLFASAGIPTMVVKHAPGTRPVAAPECVARSQATYDPCALPRGQRQQDGLPLDPVPSACGTDELPVPGPILLQRPDVPRGYRRTGCLLRRPPHQRDIRANARALRRS